MTYGIIVICTIINIACVLITMWNKHDKADRKTENSSEKPNNSTISKMEQVDKDINVRSKTENSSEKPNNCEHITEDGVTCARYPACDDCPDNPLNKVKGSERLVKGSEVTTDCRQLERSRR